MAAQPEVDFEHEVAEAFLVTHTALEKAAAAHEHAKEQQEKCAALIPELVTLAVKTAAIAPDEREAFSAALANPVQALQLFKFAMENFSTTASIQAREVDAQGRPASVKKASARGNPFVGGGAGREKANAAFDEALGIS